MDIPLILSTYSASKELLTLLINERDSQKAAAIKVDLTEKLTTAQIQLMEVIAAVSQKDSLIHHLTEQVRQLEAAQREKERYSLCSVSLTEQLFAYRLRPKAELSERIDEPDHFICQPCFDVRGAKSVLQRFEHEWKGTVFLCANCNAELSTFGPIT